MLLHPHTWSQLLLSQKRKGLARHKACISTHTLQVYRALVLAKTHCVSRCQPVVGSACALGIRQNTCQVEGGQKQFHAMQGWQVSLTCGQACNGQVATMMYRCCTKQAGKGENSEQLLQHA